MLSVEVLNGDGDLHFVRENDPILLLSGAAGWLKGRIYGLPNLRNRLALLESLVENVALNSRPGCCILKEQIADAGPLPLDAT